jgi:uncharacterized Fe-S center protein
MKAKSLRLEHTLNPNVLLETKKCTACWKCIEVCSNHAIGRINLPWHKHVKLINGSNCTGCLKCIKVCESHALSKISTN